MGDARRLVWDILAVDRASKVFDHIAEKGEHMGGRVGRVGGLITGALAGAATAGVGVLALAFGEGLKSAVAYQKITAQTAAVVKSTGGAAGVSAKHVKELADSISDYSGMTDEAVSQGENLLLTFTGIQNKAGRGNKIFDRATRTLADMSTALGEDPKNAAIQLGKALNDPIKGVTALQRVGVSFTAKQKDTIKTLVASGHTMKAQKLILGELHKEFGGSARAAGDTFAGSMTKLKNAVGDALRDGLLPLLPSLTKAADWLGKRLPGAIKAVQGWFGRLKARFSDTSGASHQVRDAIRGVWQWIQGNLAPALQNLVQTVWPPLKNALRSLGSAWKSMVPTLRALGIILTSVVLPVLSQVASAALKVLAPALKIVGSILNKVLVPAIRAMMDIWLTLVGTIINGAAKAFGWVPKIGPKLKKAASDFATFKNKVNAQLDGIKNKTVHVTIKYTNKGVNLTAPSSVGRNAGGTDNWRGGLSWVGERGPELVDLPSGSKVHTASASRGMSRQAAPPVHIYLKEDTLYSGRYVMKALQEVERATGQPLQIHTR